MKRSLRVKEKAALIAKRKAQLTKKETPAEMVMKKILDALGLKYKFQYPVWTHKSFYVVDFFIKGYKLVIEVDGRQHRRKSQMKYDKKRTQIIERRNLKVLRFWNDEVMNESEKVKRCISSEISKYTHYLTLKKLRK